MFKKEITPSASTEEREGKGDVTRGNFVNETKAELTKVVWPSRQQLISESIAVILMVTLVATVIYLVDNLFSWVAQQPFLFG